MFRMAAFTTAPTPTYRPEVVDEFFRAHPAVIASFMERAWQGWIAANPLAAYQMPAMPPNLLAPLPWQLQTAQTSRPHLIEAFCMENTRIVEIFQRVVALFTQGEQLAAPPDRRQPPAPPPNLAAFVPGTVIEIAPWLRTTEMIFFGDQAPWWSFGVTSALRPDPHLVRQNAYIRMFGANVLNPIQNDPNVKALPPAASNREFWPMLERLLAEVWRGIIHARNTSGRNDTDNAAMARYCLTLNDMLGVRRLGGNLQREEFMAGCLLNWLHVAIIDNTPIVKALKAEADSPADRLIKLGERVGVPAHSRTVSYIQLACLLGGLLDEIEAGLYNTPLTVTNLFTLPQQQERMSEIITLYTNATGRDLKASMVAVAARA